MARSERYDLFAVAVDGDPRTRRWLGRYASCEAALQALDDDLLQQLAAADGWRIDVRHEIELLGPTGPQIVLRQITTLGTDPACGVVPTRDDWVEARARLRADRRALPDM